MPEEELPPKVSELLARWEWMCCLLDGEEVSDFALSFPEVRKVADLIQELQYLRGENVKTN